MFAWKENHFRSSVVEVLPRSGSFIAYMGVHFPVVDFDNAIRFSTLSRMSGFLWNNSKWACWFGCFLQYTSGLEVLAPTALFLETLSKVAVTFREKMRQHFGCILIYRYVNPATLSPGSEAICWIFSNMHKAQADFI